MPAVEMYPVKSGHFGSNRSISKCLHYCQNISLVENIHRKSGISLTVTVTPIIEPLHKQAQARR